MPVDINDRPIEAVREEVVDQLIMNYSHGQLSYDAFERRLDQAMATSCNEKLIELVADLDLAVDKTYVDSKKEDLGINYVPGEAEDVETMINVFSGSNTGSHRVMPKEIRAISIFSGSDIDLSEAIFTEPVLRIKLFSLFSGDNIFVPDNVNVVSKAFCILGSIDVSIPSHANRQAPTIIIEGLSIFSGVDIKVKRSLKERFMDFAEQFKKLIA